MPDQMGGTKRGGQALNRAVREKNERKIADRMGGQARQASRLSPEIERMANARYQRGYHGSPYEFERFDNSRIGSGEGAQAYGYGTYHSENINTAKKGYAEKLSPANNIIIKGRTYNFARMSGLSEPMKDVIWALDKNKGQLKPATEDIKRSIQKNAKDPAGLAEYTEALNILNSLKQSDVEYSREKGHLYEVEIPENHNLIEYGKTVGEQNPQIRKALHAATKEAVQRYAEENKIGDQTAIDDLGVRYLDDIETQRLYGTLQDSGLTSKEVSELLNNYGIKGIRYLDGNSRAAGEGAYNYVIFDDKDITDVKRLYQRVNDKFNEDLEKFKVGELPENYVFKLGTPGWILARTGFPENDIELTAEQLKTKIDTHSFSPNDIKDLVLNLQEPVAVFWYGDRNKAQNVIVEIQKDNKNFLVGIHFNQKRNNARVSDIRTLFDKDTDKWLNWIPEKLLYANIEKLKKIVGVQQTNSVIAPTVERIIQDNENIKHYFPENNIGENQGKLAPDTKYQRPLAPNGAPSNLTPEQWRQVRTAEFKRWFGDWEKDPAHASKVVDENGEPLVVYHGTQQGGFNIFKHEEIYFSDNNDLAREYAEYPTGYDNKKVYTVYLKIKNPATLDFGDKNYWGNEDEFNDFIEKAKRDGHDGAIVKNIADSYDGDETFSATDYVVFTPDQIKSATDNTGAFDASNPDIRYQRSEDKDTHENKKGEISMPTIEEYKNPKRDYRLPDIPEDILNKLNKPNKPVVLKKNIIEKNKINHPEVSIDEYNDIIDKSLYRANEILQPNFKAKPNYFNFVNRANPNNVTVIELAENKDNYEIVGFWKSNDDKVEIMELKTSRDGGQSIITDKSPTDLRGQQPTSALPTGVDDIIPQSGENNTRYQRDDGAEPFCPSGQNGENTERAFTSTPP